MENAIKNYEDVDSWKTVMFLYTSALKEVGTKLEILNDEFQHVHQYNPIEHIKTRVKTAESIVKKLRKYGYEISIENMVKYVNDIAGVRLICSFTSDIYRLAEMIGNQSLSLIHISLRSRHIKRLTNNQCNTEAGIVFLDTLVCLERISDHARNIAEEVLESVA